MYDRKSPDFQHDRDYRNDGDGPEIDNFCQYFYAATLRYGWHSRKESAAVYNHLSSRSKLNLDFGEKVSLRLSAERIRRRVAPYGERLLLLEGKRAAWDVAQLPISAGLKRAGFGVFSQYDEDGIIQFLINHVEIKNETFVEFGVEHYEESNTRFLLLNDNWRGMVIDGSEENIGYIKNDRISRRFDLQSQCSFITKDNINELIRNSGFAEDLGLLSVDIDGNDYWVWEAIDVVRPRIVVAEYNSVFGHDPVSTPYLADFQRTKAHFSNLYYGCSLSALAHLAGKKGYRLVGSSLRGNNAFFLRNDIAGAFPEVSARDAYVSSPFREGRDAKGRLTFLRGAARRKAIAHLPVVNVITGQTAPLGE